MTDVWDACNVVSTKLPQNTSKYITLWCMKQKTNCPILLFPNDLFSDSVNTISTVAIWTNYNRYQPLRQYNFDDNYYKSVNTTLSQARVRKSAKKWFVTVQNENKRDLFVTVDYSRLWVEREIVDKCNYTKICHNRTNWRLRRKYAQKGATI